MGHRVKADAVAHLDALVGDKNEPLIPKTCSICRWSLGSTDPDVKALVAKMSAPTSCGKPRGGRAPAPYVPARAPVPTQNRRKKAPA